MRLDRRKGEREKRHCMGRAKEREKTWTIRLYMGGRVKEQLTFHKESALERGMRWVMYVPPILRERERVKLEWIEIRIVCTDVYMGVGTKPSPFVRG